MFKVILTSSYLVTEQNKLSVSKQNAHRKNNQANAHFIAHDIGSFLWGGYRLDVHKILYNNFI